MIDIPTLKFILSDGVQLLKLLGLVALPTAALAALVLWRMARRAPHKSE